MAKIDVDKTMKDVVLVKKKRTFGIAKPQAAIEESNDITAEELDKAKKENLDLQESISELRKSVDASSESLAKANEAKAALEKTVSELKEKYSDTYIPQGYKLGKVPIALTVYYSKQAEVFGNNFFESAAAAPMIASIETSGLAQPIVVREFLNKLGEKRYEIIIGHSRVEVYRFLRSQDKPGYKEKYAEIEAKIYGVGALDDETAEDLFYESNFAQRGKLPVKATAMCVAHFANKMKKLHDPNSNVPWYQEFSERFQMARASIFEWQAVAKLNDEFINLIKERKLKQKFATKIAKLSPADQAKLWQQCSGLITNKYINQLAITDKYNIDDVIGELQKLARPVLKYNRKAEVRFADEAAYKAFLEWSKSRTDVEVVN